MLEIFWRTKTTPGNKECLVKRYPKDQMTGDNIAKIFSGDLKNSIMQKRTLDVTSEEDGRIALRDRNDTFALKLEPPISKHIQEIEEVLAATTQNGHEIIVYEDSTLW